MPRPKKPTPAQAQKIFDKRVADIVLKYRKTLEAAKGHPKLTTYWRSGYGVKAHRVTGHWVIRASQGKKQ